MRAAAALTEPDALLRLLERFEPQARRMLPFSTPGLAGGLIVPSPIDPGALMLFIVASSAPTARAAGEKRWWAEHRDEIAAACPRLVSNITVIFPGAWPERVYRTGTGNNIRTRLVSAVHHLWVDRLKLHDAAGDIDRSARVKLLNGMAGEVTREDNERYTAPSLYPVDDANDTADKASRALLLDSPDPQSGLTVLFGPGGIGKSFFLRRISSRLARQSEADLTVGIPAYAELPLLLHTDALETWLSARGIRLPLDAIRVLIEEGVIVPILDALDELVRGQAREGSRQFLNRLGKSMGDRARGVLSSRDYYLNLDPIVLTELGARPAYLKVGYFDRPGRRRYVQVRTGLDSEHAARWANQLEAQAAEALIGATEDEIASLVGHPLFLDAFCQMIVDIPEDRRAKEADSFQLRSPNIFGEILDRVLQREHTEKFLPGWQSQGYDTRLRNPWKDPFTPDLQRQILRRIVLKVAAEGGREALRLSAGDSRYRRLRHGLFSGTANESAVTAFGEIIKKELGEPETEPHIPESEAEALCSHAVNDLVEAFRSHTLADTQPDLPERLIFATRHRAYFDYILAEAVLGELIRSLQGNASGLDEDFVLWCIEHNIIEHGDEGEAPPFASCLDFVLWHREAVADAARAVEQYLSPAPESIAFSEELASYVCSLALALLLRYGQRRGGAQLTGFDAASERGCLISIYADIAPTIKNLTVDSCFFSHLALFGVDLQDVQITDTELGSLQIGEDAVWRRVRLSVNADELSFRGRVDLENCILDIRGTAASSAQVEWTPGTKVVLRGCSLSPELYERLKEQASVSGSRLQMHDCTSFAYNNIEQYSPGRKLVNRLINLCRKHGHKDYGVFREKLKGRSLVTAASFSSALNILAQHGVIEGANAQVLKLTQLAEEYRYSGKAVPGQRTYADVAVFWDPIVEELDKIFGE